MIGADRDPLRFHFESLNQGVALPSPGVNLRCRSTLASFYGPAMTLSETASRFDLSAAWFNALAERASMQTLESLDFEKVHRHNQWLARAMREALLAHSIPFEDHGIERGSTIFATAPSSPDAAERLKSAGVVAAMRSGRIRLSLHVYNTEAQVEHVAALLKG